MIAAFILGFVGSLHCVGMCGPLTLTLMNGRQSLTKMTSYHLGRLLTYACIGALLGFIGVSLTLIRFQQAIAVALGAGLIIYFLIPGLRHRVEAGFMGSRLYARLKSAFYSGGRKKGRWFLAGMLNGILPCGIVFMAVGMAVSSGSFFDSVFYMISFGLGTLPALIAVAIGKEKIGSVFPKFSLLVPMLAVFSGVLVLLRAYSIDGMAIQNDLVVQLMSICQ